MAANEDSLGPTPKVPSLELFSLKGQNVLMTGGSRGIGQAIALGLSQAGARVIIAQRDISNTTTRDQIRQAGGSSDIIKCDLSDLEDCKNVFGRALEVVESVDVLVNCGGMLIRTDSVDVPLEEWQQVLNVNLNSLFIICQSAGKHFIPRHRGKIINIASLNSYIGGFRVASYSAAKGAVGTLTKALSNEWAKYGICVNAIAPGSIATDINAEARKNPEFIASRLNGTPGGRWGTPEDFVGPTIFLASAASQFVTGEMLVVDGGAMAKGPI